MDIQQVYSKNFIGSFTIVLVFVFLFNILIDKLQIVWVPGTVN